MPGGNNLRASLKWNKCIIENTQKKSLVNFGGSPRAVGPYRAVYPTNSLYSMEGLYGPRGSQGHLGVVYGVGVGASYSKHAMQL